MKPTYKAQKQTASKPVRNSKQTTTTKFVDTTSRHSWLSQHLGGTLTALTFTLFILWAAYMLIGRNADYLYTVSDHSLFLFDKSFFNTTNVRPGGFTTWLALFCSQFFHYPVAGALLLIIIWSAIAFISIKAFNLRAWQRPLALLPVVALLCSVVVVGYWIFYLKVAGYSFAPSIGLLINMLAVWAFRYFERLHRKASLGWMFLWCIAGYILTGWWGLFATLLMAIIGRGRGLGWLIAAAGIISVPLISYHFCTQMRIEDAWTVGFPMFQIDKYISWIPMIPMFAAPILILMLALIGRYATTNDNSQRPLFMWLSTVITIAAVIAGSLYADFDDPNFHAEQRIYRAADEGRWNDVLREAHDLKTPPTREIVMFKNLALTYNGNIGDNMFKYENLSIPPYTRDSLSVRMAQTNAPLVYMYYARLNFATRWCIENGVEMGFNPNDYKVLARCAMIAGETDLAQKYINILKKTMFYREWAEKYEPFLSDTTVLFSLPEFANQREYYNHYRSMLDGDEGLVEMYLLQYFSQTMNKDSRLLQETTLVFALQSKDIQLFWPRFFLYAHMHPNEPMPIHYQEAAYLYGNLEHEIDISGMPFDEVKIRQRYDAFNHMSQSLIQQGKSIEEVGQIMKPTYGDTFWWFYFFCRGINSY